MDVSACENRTESTPDVCASCSADELVVTELLFNGVFNDLTPEQCCALMSCFAFQEKSQRFPRLTEQLSGPLRLLQVGCRYIGVARYLQQGVRKVVRCSDVTG